MKEDKRKFGVSDWIAVFIICAFFVMLIIAVAEANSEPDYDLSHLRNYNSKSYGGVSSSYSTYNSADSYSSSSDTPVSSAPKTYSSYRNSSAGKTSSDRYGAKNYSNAEDFYDDNYDDFFDYYDAENYYNDYGD